MEIDFKEPIPGDIGWLISTHGLIYSRQFKFDLNFELDIAKKVITFYEKPNGFNLLLIAHVNGERSGSIAVSLKPDNTAFINFLMVKTECRGRGVAKKLMDKVIAHTKDHRLNVLRLETYSCLVDARELYKKYGFKRFKINKDVEVYGQVFDQEFWEKRL